MPPASSSAPGPQGGADGVVGPSGLGGGEPVRRRTPCGSERPMASPCWGESRPRLLASSSTPGSCGGAGVLSCASGLGYGHPDRRRTPRAVARARASSPCCEEGCPRLLVFSSAPGPHGGAGGLSCASGLGGRSSCLTAYSLRGGASDGLSLLRGGTSAAPGVLIGARSSWRPLRRQRPSRWASCLEAYSLRGGAPGGLSLLGEGPTLMGGGAPKTSAARDAAAAPMAGASGPRACEG